MFDALKGFLSEIAGGEPSERRFEANDYRLAAAALLVHIATIDGEFDANERERLQAIVESRFGLNRATARELIQHASESEREAVDLFRFTSVLKRTLDEEGRRQVVAMLWEMAYVDGSVHEFEENVVWRVAELLGVSSRDRVMLRKDAEEEAAVREVPAEKESFPGPWSKS
ncbi:TerB family tellurite resistance protein [Methylocystis heyeri]|uniref:TerB family tellurite resistance protein n=1 Tax=Methylocystis heyeri TaxID=391905 RepID=A0A6B8K9Q2_9HYPH|nr:TerB family tellurite resistance protein [Methylocystis heyeri]QGM44579.1 TerB family tellurite resistance protein [Methylocystis heyeri]